MENNSELEEGEACYYKEDDDDNKLDPDIALSYIDEKIQNVLGHFQKDFEGGVSAENLGAKFGGYGSFLPSNERTPAVVSHLRTPHRNSNLPRPPKSIHMEGASSLQVPSNAPTSARSEAASYGSNLLHNSGVAPGDVSVKQSPGSFPAVTVQKSTLKTENSSQLHNQNEQRTLKFRLKLGSDNVKRKNAEIYSGLGLDNSPSSSLGNSPEASVGMLSRQGMADESPTSILQVMTSFTVPGGTLISPLHDSLLCLIRKEKLSRDSKFVCPPKSNQEHSPLMVEELVSVWSDKKLSKEVNLLGNSGMVVELKQWSDINSDIKSTFYANKNLENCTPESKDILSTNLKNTCLLNTYDVSTKPIGRASKISMEANEDGLRDKLLSSDLVKENSLESISGQGSGKSEKKIAKGSLVENVSEHGPVACDGDVSADLRSNARYRNDRAFFPSKASFDSSKCKEDHNVGSLAPSKQKVGQQVMAHVQDETTMPCRKEKLSLEGKKKSKGTGCGKKAAAVSTKESLNVSMGTASKDMTSANCGVSTTKEKMHKRKSQKDANKVLCSHGDLLDLKLKHANNRMGSLERPSADRPKDPGVSGLEIEHKASFVDGQLISTASVKDAALVGPPVAGNAIATGVVPPEMNPVVINEYWVECDNCQKWRLHPFDMKDQLPDKWLCSMQTWLPGMNRCDISEEEMINAFNALYQLPLAGAHNNLQNNASGTAIGLSSAHVQQSDQKQQCHKNQGLKGKKKQGLKEIAIAGSGCTLVQTPNPTKNHLKESMKSGSLMDMKQHPAEPNLVSRHSNHHLSKSHNLNGEKHMLRNKVNCRNGGNAKQVNVKIKRAVETDPGGYETSKKMKKEGKHQNSDHHLEKVGLNFKSSLSVKARGKKMQRSKECSLLEDVKWDKKEVLASTKKPGDQEQYLLGAGSLDIRTGNKGDASVKKRKLREGQNSQNGHDNTTLVGEISQSQLKMEKKSRILKSVGKESSTGNANDKLTKKDSVFYSGSKDHSVHEDFINSGKDQQPRKHRRNQLTLDASDVLRKDFGSGQALMTATSSSSKVSGSLKTREIFDDVKGSPVESVSSSPLRTSFPEKLTSAGGDILGKDDAVNGILPVIGRYWDGEAENEVKRSGTARKDKTATKDCHDDDRMENLHGQVLSPQKFSQGSSLQSKDSDRSSTSDFDTDTMKASGQVRVRGNLFSRNSMRYESEINLKRMDNSNYGIPDKSSTKLSEEEKDNISSSNAVGQCSKGTRMENWLKLEECHSSGAKTIGTGSRNIVSQQKHSHDVDAVKKATSIQNESRSGPAKVFSHSEGEGKQESQNRQCVPGSQREATNALEEAKRTRNCADLLKSSGCVFESNEVYFQAALQFLNGAFLLESCNYEGVRRAEMNQMQVYGTAAKLCECCALEYERRHEMAAAALAYKCMEVAYWRMVYCKNSSLNKDRNDLQASLQMILQGESPSSSASDIDHLNNQTTGDKAISLKGVVSQFAGNAVNLARNHANFLRLLDFTQDVNSAVEASRKSQNAFSMANVALEEAQNGVLITSVKRVINFNFQDIEGLIRLVQQAREAISN